MEYQLGGRIVWGEYVPTAIDPHTRRTYAESADLGMYDESDPSSHVSHARRCPWLYPVRAFGHAGQNVTMPPAIPASAALVAIGGAS